jgi:hypothetical protein
MKKPVQESPEQFDPSQTTTEPPAIEPVPDFTPARGFRITMQKVAPDYRNVMVTILDRFGYESRWLAPDRMTSEDLEILKEAHRRASQGQTRRN